MKNRYLPVISFTRFIFSGKWFHPFLLIATAVSHSPVHAQQITINPRSSMVLNGNVFLVANNIAFHNNGAFAEGTGTVKFTGHEDTLVTSHVSGTRPTTFYNLTVSKSAYGVALKSPVKVRNVLDVNAGNLYTDSNLTLRSDKDLTARVAFVPAASNIYGKTNVERYIPTRRSWRLMTAPVTSSNSIYNSWQNRGVYTVGIGALVTGPNPTGAAGNGLDSSYYNNISIKGWDYNTQAFANVVNTIVPNPLVSTGSGDNVGYFVFVRGDRDPNNTNISYSNITTLTSVGILQTQVQVFPVSPVAGKYTLIGNPYASPVDFDKVALQNVLRRFYVWDPYLNLVGGYVMMDDLFNTHVYTPSVPGAKQKNDLQSSQAFFVQTDLEGAASITFNETSKSGINNNLMFRPATGGMPAGTLPGQLSVTLNLLNAGNTIILADGVIAQFASIFSAGVDLNDAVKFGNTGETFSIVRNNVLLAAERRPTPGINDTIFFRLTTTSKRNYQFVLEAKDIEQPGLAGYLQDSYLGTSSMISLTGTTTVNFTINAVAASAAINRFRIVFKPLAALPVTLSSVKAYQKNNGIAVEWKVENEINMWQYEVEKSTDGTVFTHANTTKVSGANNAYNAYSWLDVNPVAGNNFYRIKSYDIGGAVHYSTIVKVTMGKTNAGISVYPNPVSGNVIGLVMNNQPAGSYQVKLTNAIGQLIFVKTIQCNGGSSTESLYAGSVLLAGIYQLEIIGQERSTLQVVVE